MSNFDIDKVIGKLLKQEFIDKESIMQVCARVIPILQSESNVIHVSSPINVCGDVHGDFLNVLQIFDIFDYPPDGRYLFLGDYVDRGDNSVDTLTIILCYKVKYPEHLFLIRGNHENHNLPVFYGTYSEILRKYGDSLVYLAFLEVFKAMPLAAIIDDRYFCVHGGLGPNLKKVEQIDNENRFLNDFVQNSLVNNILWSDPSENPGYTLSPRGSGYFWGPDVTKQFLHENNLLLIIRGHENQDCGFKFNHDDLVLTIFSSPHYNQTFKEGAILEITSPTEIEITKFRAKEWDDLSSVIFPNLK